MNPQNTTFRGPANRRHRFGRNVLTVCLLLTLFFLATLSLPQIAKPVRADLSKERRTEQKLVPVISCGQYIKQVGLQESAQFASTLRLLASAPRPVPRGGPPGACNEGEFECHSNRCYHQCLVCPSGWTVTEITPCSAKCCNLDECGETGFCTPL